VCGRAVDGTVDNLVLNCTGGLYQTLFQCPPSEPCANIVGHDQIRCGGSAGTYFAKEGIACFVQDGQACSFDQRVVLKCTQGKWLTAIHCAPSSCAYHPEGSGGCIGTWCANCGYTPGDACSFSAASVQCSADLSQIVECRDGTATVWQACGSGHCTAVTIDGIPQLVCE
jgi:hypothetical protein